jgi:hypothetical protein
MGGTITHGMSFFSSSIGTIAEVVFLKISGGLTTTLPPRWNLP